MLLDGTRPSSPWPDYRAVWRWHFYAGLFCFPFVVVLAISGTIYLFTPQIEAWLDRPYDHLAVTGQPAGAAAQAQAALAAVPGSTLFAYELPTAPDTAVRVIVKRGDERLRVYLHPETLAVLKVVGEEDRLMRVIFRLHGELLAGNIGSAIVETASSWTIVMIATGLSLWWPRSERGLGGVLYPRLGRGGRAFWHDLHAVTGFWISFFVLFLLLTGLPWAKVWGEYFKSVRRLTGTAVARQDWTVGAERSGTASGGHGDHPGAPMGKSGSIKTAPDYSALDRLIETVRPLDLPPPVLLSPPAKAGAPWTAKSDTQNRPLRVNLTLDGATGAILKREDFKDRHVLDRMVGIGVAAHEGQLFGWPNQVVGALTALGLLTLAASSVTMWWRRRAPGVLGAPEALQPPRFSKGLPALVLLFSLYLPLFAASLIVVLLTEHFMLRRIPAARNWLGLA